MILSPRLVSRQACLLAWRRHPPSAPAARTARHGGGGLARPASNSNANASAAPARPPPSSSALPLAAAALLSSAAAAVVANDDGSLAQCSMAPMGADPILIAPVKEPATGKMFPRLCNGMTLAGCGVRVKWGLIKVYAVGTYLDPLSISMVKSQGDAEVKKALLDPSYPRTIRIVMNRGLSIDKYTGAIVEALEPRMGGEDLGSLEEFKRLNPKVDLIEGAEMEMTIRGDVLLYKNAVGGLGQIRSAVFTRAMCDVFYGDDAVSPTHLESVLSGVKNL